MSEAHWHLVDETSVGLSKIRDRLDNINIALNGICGDAEAECPPIAVTLERIANALERIADKVQP